MQEAVTAEGAERSGLGRYVSVLEGIRPYQRSWLQADIFAGITLAALAIPEVMGYTKIAAMPVITGLYTMLIPVAAFITSASQPGRWTVSYIKVCAPTVAELEPGASTAVGGRLQPCHWCAPAP